MMKQTTLFAKPRAPFLDKREGERRREEAINRARRHSPTFQNIASAAIYTIARTRPTFTTDQIWQVLDQIDIVPTHEPRAMGAAMRRAQGDGMIAPTDKHVLSERPTCHRRPIRVWRSLLANG